jgi:hypothetical protein
MTSEQIRRMAGEKPAGPKPPANEAYRIGTFSYLRTKGKADDRNRGTGAGRRAD